MKAKNRPLTQMIVVPRHFLADYQHNRRYAFEPRSDGTVAVRRYERFVCTSDKILPKPQARRLYAWLCKLGYQPW